jgi:single-strand DNA-binding protein
MNGLRNKVQLIGRLGQDPEVKTLESGKKVAHFNVATKESYKNAEGTKIDETTWHSIVAWNGLAELSSRFLSKGREVCIEGRIAYRSYTDKTGIQRNVTEIVATDLVMLSSGNRSREIISDEADETSVVEPSIDSEPAGRGGKPRGK